MNKIKYHISLLVISIFIAISSHANTNDVCGDAIPLTVGEALRQGDNITASPDIHNSCQYNKASVWYTFTVDMPGSYGIEISNTTLNDVLTLYSGSCGALSEIACTNNDEFGFEGEKLYMDLLSDVNYYLMVSGADCTFGNVLGYFSVQVVQGSETAGPQNEECGLTPTNNIDLTSGTAHVTGSTLDASKANPHPSCSPYAGASVWYKLDGASNNLKVSSAPNMTEIITLYSGDCDGLIEMGCKVNEVNNPDPLIVILTDDYPPPYYMQVTGSFTSIEADFSGAISSDDFYIEIETDFECSAYIGKECNDNNPNTFDDKWDDSCNCVGTCIIPENGICDDGNPNTTDRWDDACNCVGTCDFSGTCNDGNNNTTNDTWDDSCNCVGTCNISSSDCPDNTMYNEETCSCDPCSPNHSCDDGNYNTVDSWDDNCNCIGRCWTIINDCPNTEYTINENCDCVCFKAGKPCDDGNLLTVDDTWDESCNCLGICTSSGQPCNDGNSNTENDTLDDSCNCVGACTVSGGACDDGNPNTINDTWDNSCNCVGECQTVASDCPSTDYGIDDNCNCVCLNIGRPCDDADALTINDIYDADCNCFGTPFSGVDCDDIVDFENFESGWGIWNDGGADATRKNNSSYASSGSYTLGIQDNTNTSVITTDNLNLIPYSEIEVNFDYFAFSMDNSNEDFWLQISTNGGVNFTTIETWAKDIDFDNNIAYSETVTIQGPFTSNTKLRFRCDASSDGDDVYLDDIEIKGCSNACLIAGQPCSDGDNCTVNDTYNSNCECIGIFNDTDDDGICDADDICPGGDDNIDIDGNGIPDACEDTCPEDLIIVGADVPGNYEAANTITTDESIGAVVLVDNDEQLTLNAGYYVKLTPGFRAAYGSTMRGYIKACEPNSEKIEQPAFVSVKHYPNPFRDEFTLEFELDLDAEMPILP